MEITKNKLKDNLLDYLSLVESNHEEIIITDHGKPILKIINYQKSPTTEELFAPFRGKVKYFEDLTTSTTDEWSEI